MYKNEKLLSSDKLELDSKESSSIEKKILSKLKSLTTLLTQTKRRVLKQLRKYSRIFGISIKIFLSPSSFTNLKNHIV